MSDSALDRAAMSSLAREVAQLLRHERPGDALMTAREVAARLNVERSWVYTHAEELGAVRIGSGPRPRLRFDPAVIEQRLLPARGRSSGTSVLNRLGADVALLPIRPARGRTLGARR
jgi:hypothetical protein